MAGVALTALAGGGNLAGALAGASAPELANIIGHNLGIDDNPEAKAIAHAILGGVTAVLQGKDAAAAGGATGDLAAQIIKEQLFPGKSNRDLSESDKQLISNLSTLASGLAGNLASGNSAGTTTAAQAGKNAVENNSLSLPNGMINYGQAVASWNQYAVDNNLTPEQTQEGLSRIATGEGPSWGTEYKVKPNGKVEVSGGVGLALKGGAEVNNDYVSISTGYTKEFGVKAGTSVGIDFGPYFPGGVGDLNRDYSTSIGFGPGSVGMSGGKDGIGFSFSVGPSIGFTGSTTGSHDEKIDLNGDSTKEIYHYDFK